MVLVNRVAVVTIVKIICSNSAYKKECRVCHNFKKTERGREGV